VRYSRIWPPECPIGAALGIDAGPHHLRAARRRVRPSPACQVVTVLEAKFPAAAEHLDEARDDILAFTAFPQEAWRQV
jgi:hypothetical protein